MTDLINKFPQFEDWLFHIRFESWWQSEIDRVCSDDSDQFLSRRISRPIFQAGWESALMTQEQTVTNRMAYAQAIRAWVLGHPDHTAQEFTEMLERAERLAQLPKLDETQKNRAD